MAFDVCSVVQTCAPYSCANACCVCVCVCVRVCSLYCSSEADKATSQQIGNTIVTVLRDFGIRQHARVCLWIGVCGLVCVFVCVCVYVCEVCFACVRCVLPVWSCDLQNKLPDLSLSMPCLSLLSRPRFGLCHPVGGY